VCTASGDQRFAATTYGAIASDGQGGCYITWEDDRDLATTGTDIYVQHLTSSGAVSGDHWPAEGLQLTNAPGNQRQSSIISDGAGGAIVVWQDEQVSVDANIRAARINPDGSIAAGWSLNGNVVCDASSAQTCPVLTTDQENGAIIAWADGRNWDIYVLRMQSDGVADPDWTANGVPLTLVVGEQTNPEITSDGFGGALVVWMDARTSGNGQDVYAQRITGTGAVVWAANGVALSTAALDQAFPRIVPNGTGGAIVVWDDKRNVSSTSDDIYAQAINAAGAVQWAADGAAITTDADSQRNPSSRRTATEALSSPGATSRTTPTTATSGPLEWASMAR